MLDLSKLNFLKNIIQKKEKQVGLYLGDTVVGAAIVEGDNVLEVARFELSGSEEAEGGALGEGLEWEALINKTLREVGANTGKAYVALADRDFIFRPLEMPLMNRSEIESSLLYEIEKYIPFKIDKLAWDYGYISSYKNKKTNLIFLGIKDNYIQKIKETLSRLQINEVVIEPSCLSLVRIVKSLKRFSKINDFSLLDLSKTEANLTFFQKNLPVFNRYLNIPKTDEIVDVEKFIEAVNISFQYFRSEFKAQELGKLIIVGDNQNNELTVSLENNLGTAIETVSLEELSGGVESGIEGVKAIGAAGREWHERGLEAQHHFAPDDAGGKIETLESQQYFIGIPAVGGAAALVPFLGPERNDFIVAVFLDLHIAVGRRLLRIAGAGAEERQAENRQPGNPSDLRPSWFHMNPP